MGLDEAPRALRALIIVAQRGVLRLRLGPVSSPAYVLGWEIAHSGPDAVHLRASSPIMRASIVADRVEPTLVSLTTYLYFERPRTARSLWAIVGPIHRRVARYLMERAATRLLLDG
jgi:hypothetical protein